MKKTTQFRLLFSLISLVFTAGCAKPHYVQKDDSLSMSCIIYLSKYQLCADLAWDEKANTTQDSRFQIQFYLKDQPLVYINPPAQVYVYLWMPSMGHGSSPITLTSIGTGIYQATDVYFIMSGLWEIRLQLKNGADILDEGYAEISL